MKRYYLAVPLLLLYSVHAWADTTAAVAATNYQAGLTTGDTYVSGNRASYMYDFNGRATFPLATYFGATLSGDYGRTNITTNPFPDNTPATPWPSCTVHTGSLDAGLFARNPSIGKLGVDYGAGRQDSHCSATFVDTGSSTLNTRHTAASAEYYFSRVTLAVERSKLHIESGNDLDSETLSAGWYPVNSSRITLAADGLDFKKTYHLNMEYQPEFLDNSMSFSFGYSTRRETVTTHSISVGFSYFFDTNANLLTRDRHYR